MNPTVLLLASGSSSRFFPLNSHIHKTGFSLLGTPIIVTVLENLYEHGFEDVVITLDADDLTDEDGLKARILTALAARNIQHTPTFVEQDRSTHIGMAGGVLAARAHLGKRFVVANPYYLDMGTRINDLIDTHDGAAIGVVETERPWDYGIVALDGDRVTGIVEKPARGEAPSSFKTMVLHVLDQTFLEMLTAAFQESDDEEYLYERVLTAYMQTHSVGYGEQSPYQSLKYAWHLFAFFEERIATTETAISTDATIAESAVIDDSNGPVIVAPGARIGDFAKVSGPCYIGADVLVGDYSFVRGSNVEANATIGAYTEVVRSLICSGSSLHQAYLADSILDEEVSIGAGFTTANKRLDRTVVPAMVKETLRNTGRRAFGTAIGRGTNIGIGCATMPGVLIGADSTIYPGLQLSRNISANSTQKTAEPTENS